MIYCQSFASIASTYTLADSRSKTKINTQSTLKPDQLTPATDLLIPAPAVNGVSVNVFTQFEVSGRKLIIYNGSRETGQAVNTDAANVIIIESPRLLVADSIEILGAPADLLLVSRGPNNTLRCQQCRFDNVGRLTLAVADPNKVAAIQKNGNIGSLTTSRNGVVKVDQLQAPGVQSVELIADRVQTKGVIDTHLRADIHPEGGFTVHPKGNKIVGSGGIAIYAGDLSINYEDLTVTHVEISEHPLIINAKLLAASIAITSPQAIVIDKASELTTASDLLASSTHKDRFYAPIEGIFIQSIKPQGSKASQHHGVELNGKLTSDNVISIKSLDDINQRASIVTEALRFISANDIYQQGYIQANEVEMAARRLINTAHIKTATLHIETQYNIHNSFGGELTAKTAVLKSQQGYVVNGSRSQSPYYPLQTQALPLSTDLTALVHGIYYDLKKADNAVSAKARTLSAHIRANHLSIDAKAIENINPYSLTRPSSTSWQAGISINNHQAQQVAIQAETHLALKARQYILNASAIIGLNQTGQFVVNTPKLSNERYRIQLESYIFNQFTLSDDAKAKHDKANVGTTTKVIAYSPPGRLYSFGPLLFSNGNDGNAVKEQLINEMSYFEVFADSHFYQTQIQSIGLAITENYDAVAFSNVKDCLRYRTCDGDNILTVAEAETLTAFGGNVYGIDNSESTQPDLNVDNINAQKAAVQRVVKAHLATFDIGPKVDAAGIQNERWGNAHSVSIEGDMLRFVEYACKLNHGFLRQAIPHFCGEKKHQQSIPELLAKEATDREVGNTGYTDRQLTAASTAYVKTLDRVIDYSAHSHSFVSYSLTHSNVLILIEKMILATNVTDDLGFQQFTYTETLPLTTLMQHLPK